jgi:fluoride exporter
MVGTCGSRFYTPGDPTAGRRGECHRTPRPRNPAPSTRAETPLLYLYIALGGGLGALARFALGGWVVTWAGGGFPWGTFAANALGSALLGLLSFTLPRLPVTARARALLTVGFCGGFTTFSTFDFEMLVLLQEGRHLLAAGYAGASVLVCVAAVASGLAAGRALPLRDAA